MRKYMIMIIVLLMASVAGAQQGPSRPPQRPDDDTASRERERIEAMLAWRMVSFLDLDETTTQKMIPVLREFSRKNSDLSFQRMEIYFGINDDLEEGKLSGQKITETINQIQAIDNQVIKLRQEYIANARKILNDEQYLKFLLFEDRLRNEFMGRFQNNNDDSNNNDRTNNR